MNLQLDPHVKAVFDDIVAHTPEIGPTPVEAVIDLDRGSSGERRRWVAVAAAAVVVVGVGALVAVERSQPDAPVTGPVATQPPAPGPGSGVAAPGGMMLFDPVPETLADAAVTATSGPDPVSTPTVPEGELVRRWYTTTMEQPELHPHLEVSSVSTTQQIDPPTGDDATAVTVQGVEGWLYDDPFGRGRSVVFHDGETLFVLTGYGLADDDLLAAAENTGLADVDTTFGAFVDSAALPAGLIERAVGTAFESHFLPLQTQQHATPMIHWEAGDISVWLQTIVEDPALVPLHRLGYDTVTDTTVHDRPAFVTTIASQPTYAGVTWSENGTTYLLGSNGLEPDTIVQYANRLRPATRTEWDHLLAGPNTPDAPDPVATTTVLAGSAPSTDVGTAPNPEQQSELGKRLATALGLDAHVLIVNASTNAGLANSLRDALTFSGYRAVQVADTANGTVSDQSTMYTHPDTALSIPNALGSALEVLWEEEAPPSDIVTNEMANTAAVVIVLGNDLADAPWQDTPPPLIDPGTGRLVIIDATSSDQGHQRVSAQADALRESGVDVAAILTSTRPVEQTMLMPIGSSTAWTFAVAELGGVGGFDTWSPDLVNDPMPDDVTAALILSDD